MVNQRSSDEKMRAWANGADAGLVQFIRLAENARTVSWLREAGVCFQPIGGAGDLLTKVELDLCRRAILVMPGLAAPQRLPTRWARPRRRASHTPPPIPARFVSR